MSKKGKVASGAQHHYQWPLSHCFSCPYVLYLIHLSKTKLSIRGAWSLNFSHHLGVNNEFVAVATQEIVPHMQSHCSGMQWLLIVVNFCFTKILSVGEIIHLVLGFFLTTYGSQHEKLNEEKIMKIFWIDN